MGLGELIKTRREAQEYSLQDVADSCGISKAHLWDLEQGNSLNPSLGLAIRLGMALNIPISCIAASTLEEKK